ARCGAEALDGGRPNNPERLAHVAAESDELVVRDRPPLDGLAALRLDHRPRDRIQAAPLEVAEDVQRELLACADLLDERFGRGASEEEIELLTILGTEDVARAETAPRLHEHGIGKRTEE